MQRFLQLVHAFNSYFDKRHFPEKPESLYDAASYMLEEGGKRIRPVLCLLGNELFEDIQPDSWKTAAAIELFHNFTLIHDDIMDKAFLRRNRPTVHKKYNEPTALLAGDVMLLQAYENLNETSPEYLSSLISQLNKAGREICEGQQMDMDFENRLDVTGDEYIRMIELKTSVLLAASLSMGATIAKASTEDLKHIYAFGIGIGLAFQIQDDYLDSFGNPEKFGKTKGGDIIANKKTFLLVESLVRATSEKRIEIENLLKTNQLNKIEKMIEIYKDLEIDRQAERVKQEYLQTAFKSLDKIQAAENKKDHLRELATYILERDN